MTQSEYIIWKVETIEQIRTEHPKWQHEDVMEYFYKVEQLLIEQGKLIKP